MMQASFASLNTLNVSFASINSLLFPWPFDSLPFPAVSAPRCKRTVAQLGPAEAQICTRPVEPRSHLISNMAPNRPKLGAVSGVHPAGVLHLGNYIGAVSQCRQLKKLRDL